MSHTMLSIRRSDVPEYLHSSQHFENAFQNDNDGLTIDIPADCLKPSTCVQNERDLRALLLTVRFWLVPEHIETNTDVFDFILRETDSLSSIIPDFAHDFPVLFKLQAVLLLPDGKYSLLGKAGKHGLLSLVKYFRAKDSNWDTGVSKSFAAISAQYGSLDCLEYAVKNGCLLNREVSELAAENGHVNCLKYAHEHGAQINYGICEKAVRSNSVPSVRYIVESKAQVLLKNRFFCEIAARSGNAEMLTYLLNAGCEPTVAAANAAAAFDHVECLKLLLNAGCALNEETLYLAVHCGALGCVKYLHEAGCPWDEATLYIVPNTKMTQARCRQNDSIPAAEKLFTLLYAAEHGCPVNPASSVFAIRLGAVELLKCIHSRGVEIDSAAVQVAIIQGQTSCLQYLLENQCSAGVFDYVVAVRYNRLECIKCMHDHKVAWDSTVTTVAVNADSADILKYLLDHKCPVNAEVVNAAATSRCVNYLQLLHEHELQLTEDVVLAACGAGAAQCLEYALRNGCSGSEIASISAASQGYVDCLRILHEHGVPITKPVYTAALNRNFFQCVAYAVTHGLEELGPQACSKAASFRSYTHLKCLHNEGVAWDINTCLSAVRNGSFECLKYAVTNDCPVNVTVMAEAALCGNIILLKWMHRKGIPWDASVTTAAVKSDSVECLKYAIQRQCPFDAEAVVEETEKCRSYMLFRGNLIVERAREREAAKELTSLLQQPDKCM